MNWDQIEGRWKQIKRAVKTEMGEAHRKYLDIIAGNKDQFIRKLQEKYGISKEEAQKQV